MAGGWIGNFSIASEYLKNVRSIEEVYALIDRNRTAAAEAARMKFRSDVDAAVAAVTDISAVATARILADSQVASAKIMIDAEVGAARLLSEAELRAAQCAKDILNTPAEKVEAMLVEIASVTSSRLSAGASSAVELIRRDAEEAVRKLKQTGTDAIRDIRDLAAKVEAQIEADAKTAAEKLAKFRARPHTPEEASVEAERAADLVGAAANQGMTDLRAALDHTFARINKITEDACLAVQDAALAAEKRLNEGRERALARLNEVLAIHRSSGAPKS